MTPFIVHVLIEFVAFSAANLDDLSSLIQNSTTALNIPGSQLSNSLSGE